MTEREYIEQWLRDERDYTVAKFGLDTDDKHTAQFNDSVEDHVEEAWWPQQFDTYLHRSRVLGLDNPGGRQALAKFAATALGMLESAVRVYGPLPEPGVPSGENTDKLRRIE